MARYTKEYKREQAARRRLEELGYTVIRSAGSRGPWDLVAYKEGQICFIQVRSNIPPDRLIERLETYSKEPLTPSYEIWAWRKGRGFYVFASGGKSWIEQTSLIPLEFPHKRAKRSKETSESGHRRKYRGL